MDTLHSGLADLADCGFEPQQRARSNTWPLPRPDDLDTMIKEEPEDDAMKSPCGSGGVVGGPPMCIGTSPLAGQATAAAAAAKKNSSRRNAWGNLSYADLITQAITTAPEKRLTLSQIYEWMVHNVPYFKDKGDSNSSAGWKNSIRHNLSLHNRFMRVQNEGTGKSSWWMINPDAKPGKSARRRATSMETSKFEKRRGRVKRKVEALRNGMVAADASPSPCSSVSEGLDMYPDSPLHSAGFQLSPAAGSGGGSGADFRPRASSNASSCSRLSPIPAVEPDWPLSSYYGPEQLAGNLEQGMKLQQDPFMHSGMHAAPPPPYPTPFDAATAAAFAAAAPPGPSAPTATALRPYGHVVCPVHRLANCNCGAMHQHRQPTEGMPSASISPSFGQSDASPAGPAGATAPGSNAGGSSTGAPDGSPVSSPQPATPPAGSPVTSPPLTPHSATTVMGQLMGALNPSIIDDLNLNFETLQGGFDCNVDELIQQELNLEGSLDFNFGQHQGHQMVHPGPHPMHLHHLHQQMYLPQHMGPTEGGGPMGGGVPLGGGAIAGGASEGGGWYGHPAPTAYTDLSGRLRMSQGAAPDRGFFAMR